MVPMLAAVDSLEARVISRLPFSPSRAGTMIRISDTSLKWAGGIEYRLDNRPRPFLRCPFVHSSGRLDKNISHHAASRKGHGVSHGPVKAGTIKRTLRGEGSLSTSH
jgi:hypothetical protein